MSITQNLVYKVDLANGTPVVNLAQPLVVGDQDAHKFIVNLTDKGYKADLGNVSCRAYFVRKKQGVYEAETILLPGTVNAESASVTLDASCYSRSAYFSLFVKLSDNVTGEIRTVLIVRGTVIISQDGNVLDPEDVVLSLDELLAQINAMEQATTEANAAAATANEAAASVEAFKGEIQGDITALTEELSDIRGTIIPEWADGYIKANGELDTGNSDWCHSEYIPLNSIKAVFVSGNFTRLNASVGYNFAFFDGNKHFIGGVTDLENPAFENERLDIPSEARYLVMSNTYVDSASVVLSYTNAIPKRLTTYVVDANGSGDFTTVAEAVAKAESGDIVYVKAGAYENEHIEGFGKDISIIGENPLNTIISCDDSTYDAPAIEFSTGQLKNLTFICGANSTGGYTIHIEDDFQYNKSLYVENCIFINKIFGSALGMGMRGGAKIHFVNCKFYKEAQGPVLYIHDANEEAYAGLNELWFENCYIQNEGNWIVDLQSQERAGAVVNMTWINNTFYNNGGGTIAPYINVKNYQGGTSTDETDFKGLINWKLKGNSHGNTLAELNVLTAY